MPELDDSLQKRTAETVKPEKAKLSELLSVCLDGSQGIPAVAPVEGPERAFPSGAKTAETKSPDAGSAPAAKGPSTMSPLPQEGGEARVAGGTETPKAAGAPRKTVGARISLDSSSKLGVWQASGLTLTVIGAMLAVAPQISAGAERWLANHSDVRLHSATLIIGGLLMFTIGLLRRTLREIRCSLDSVSSETARLEEIAQESHALRDNLNTVRVENTALTEHVVSLQSKIKRLIEIVSNPDYTMSIFRLAASVDQLGKRVEVYMQEQFGLLQQRTDAIAQHGTHAEQRLTSTLGQLDQLVKQQHKAQQLAVREGFDELGTASDQTAKRIDLSLEAAARIEDRIQGQQESVSNGLASLSEHTDLNTSQLASCVNELRGRIDRQIETQATSLRSEFEELESRLDQAERSQTTGIKQLTDQVKAQFAIHVEALQQNLKLLADLTGRANQEAAAEFDGLGTRLDEYSKSQLTSMQQVRELSMDSARSTKGEIVSNFEQLKAQLDELERGHLAALHRTSQETQQAAGTTKREVAAHLEQLKTQMEQQARDHLAALRKTAQEVAKAAGSSRQELTASLELVREHLEQLSRDHLAALHQSALDAQQSSGATKRDLAASLEHIGTRIETTLEVRANGLANAMTEVAEMFKAITAEVRTCIVESIAQAAAPNAEDRGSSEPAIETEHHEDDRQNQARVAVDAASVVDDGPGTSTSAVDAAQVDDDRPSPEGIDAQEVGTAQVDEGDSNSEHSELPPEIR